MAGQLPTTALVLAAGLGTRFAPLSSVRAKAAVPLAGESLIRRILRWLRDVGVQRAVVNLHHRPETIAAEVGDGSDLGIAVRYSWEPRLLGSAGGPRHALPLIEDETFLIVNGDHLTALDLAPVARAHADSGALVTLALSPRWDPVRYGGVALEAGGAVAGFVRRDTAAPGTARHFFGVQIVHRSVFADLSDDQPAESFTGVYPALLARRPGSVRGAVSDPDFWDIGTPEDYLATAIAISRREGHASPPLGRRARVAATSRLVDTVVWDDVVIEDDCALERCIVADGVRLASGSRLRDAAIVRSPDGEPQVSPLAAPVPTMPGGPA